MSSSAPPPILDCARVIAYAVTDSSVAYTERGNFFVNGKLLGAVPRLAICKNIGEEEILIFHCDNEWSVLGASGGNQTVGEAKEWVERSYRGLTSKWIETGVTEEEAVGHLGREFADEICSFCGKWPTDVELMIGEEVRICNFCVDKFYAIVHRSEGDV